MERGHEQGQEVMEMLKSLWSSASSPGRLEAWMREQQWARELLRVGVGDLILQGPQAMLTSQDFIQSSGERIDSGTGGVAGSNLY